MSVEDLLLQNRVWAEKQVRRDPEYFTRQLSGQSPRLLWIGCSDSRVPAEEILGCGPGELFVHRNVANVVAYNDINVAAVVQFATLHLKVPDIVVCGHYNCGGVQAACADVLHHGYIGDWLMITGWAKRWVEERLQKEAGEVSREEFLRLVVEENVRLQVQHLAHLSVMREAWERNPDAPKLHGWVYDIGTGIIKDVGVSAP